MAVVPSPDIRAAVAESLIRDHGRVSEWWTFGRWNWMQVRPRLWLSRGLAQFIPSHPINYWRNCTEGVWWPCHIGSDVWFQDDLWETLARFPEQLLKDLVSWGSPGDCSMIDRFLGDALEVLSCQFLSTVLQSGARLPIHTLNYWTVQSVVRGF